MSGLYENQKTIRSLKARINDIKPKNGEKYYFVFGYPRSDIGKGTLVAQLLAVTPGSDAIKFDGLLNTNKNGRHTAVGHDDFGVYEKYNAGKRWGEEHYLLGGELYRDFISEFGENENLQINPHLSFYVEYRIHKMWNDIGRPKCLFIEVGGLITDAEVDPIFTPIAQRLVENDSARIVLLSETAWNNEFIKTKTVQSAIKEFESRRLRPWLLVAREPLEVCDYSFSERLEFERVISGKIQSAFNFRLARIISVPHYKNLSLYEGYIRKRFVPLLANLNTNILLIATLNASKLADYKLYLGSNFNLISPVETKIELDVPEGIDSIEDNAMAKGRAWAVSNNMISLGDDTGFFIRELNGEPGVALRRWGGELPKDATNKDFWEYLQIKTKDLEKLDCYFEQCVAIVTPTGETQIIYNRNEGFLNKEKLRLPYNGTGYPLGMAFESYNRKKTWDEMTDDEKKVFDNVFINKLNSAINSLK